MQDHDSEIIEKLIRFFPNYKFEIRLTRRTNGTPWKTIFCNGSPLRTGWNPEQADEALQVHGTEYEISLKESIITTAIKELQLRGF